MNTIRAVLFDIDGTLVDSNYLHVEAWHRAFQELGEPIDAWRIYRLIGMDSARLLEELVSERDADWRSRAKETQSRFYKPLTPRLRRFTGTHELLGALHESGVQIVLATSAPEEELHILLSVLDCDDLIDAQTSADDVEEAKPDPGLVGVALERAGASPNEAVFIGDAVWDMVAATRAGVMPLAVGSGGIGANELTEAGAVSVFDDVDKIRSRMVAAGGFEALLAEIASEPLPG
jgi:HAD superfamily hydrolase (TIGR01549 family)